MIWNTLGLLALLACSSALAVSEPAWMGREVDVRATSFCKRYGCERVAVRQNTENNMGWHDGQQVTYRLGNGALMELDLRPADMSPGQGRWISNARLSPPGMGKGLPTPTFRLAADFYSVLTGRPFSLQAVGYCRLPARSAVGRHEDQLNPANLMLSIWTTPTGLPYRARCGQIQALFWVGWMQA